MASSCPNISSQDWKDLVSVHGEEQALRMYIQNGYEIPVMVKKDMNPKLFGNKYLFNGSAVTQKLNQDPKLARKVLNSLMEQFPDVNINPDALFDAEGNWVKMEPGTRGMHVRNAFVSAVAFSNEALIETIPHEYAHEYIQLFKNHPMVRKALSKHSEEQLADEFGKYYAGRKNANWFVRLLDDVLYLVRSVFSTPSVTEQLARSYYRGKNLGEKQKGEGYVSYQKARETNYPNHNKRVEGTFNPNVKYDRFDITQVFMPSEFVDNYYNTRILKKLTGPDGSFDYNRFHDHLIVHITRATEHKLGLNKRNRVDVTDYNHAELDSNLLKQFREFITNPNGSPNIPNLQEVRNMLEGKEIQDYNRDISRIVYRIHQSIGIYDEGSKVLDGYQEVVSDNIFAEQNKIVEKEKVVNDVTVELDVKLKDKKTFFSDLTNRIPKQLSFLKKLDLSKVSPWLYDGYLISKSLTGKTNSVFRKLFYDSLDKATNDFYDIQNNFDQILTIDKLISNYDNWGTADKQGKHIDDYETIEFQMIVGKETKPIKLTKSEAATLYFNLKQNDTSKAIFDKGIILNDHIDGRDIPFNEPIQLTSQSLLNWFKTFESDPEFSTIISAVRKGMDYLYDQVSPTFLQLNGYELEKIQNFFPAYYGKATLDQRKQKKIIEQFRSAHARLGGDVPVRIHDLKSVINNYSVASGMYSAYSLPIRNNRIVLSSIRDKYVGTALESRLNMVEGFLNKMEDPTLLYSSQGEKRFEQIINENLSNFTVYVLGYNQFVVFKQTASYMAAKEYIPSKYLKEAGNGLGPLIIPKLAPFFKSLKKVDREQNLDVIRKLLPIEYRMDESNKSYMEMKEYSPYLTHRFEGHVNRELSEALMNRSKGKDIIELNLPGFKKPIKFSKTRAMEGIRVMDAVTVTGIWDSVKLWTNDRIAKGELRIERGSKQYWEHVATTAEFAIKRTQPVSDIINRSAVSSEKNPLLRTITMFSSATQQMGKLMIDRVMDFNNNPTVENRKKMFATAANVMLMTSIYVTLIDMIKVLFMHGFEDKEEVVSFSTHNIISNMAGYFHGFGTLIRMVSSRIDDQPWRASLQHPIETLGDDLADAGSNLLTGEIGKALKDMLDITMKVKGVPGFPLKTGTKLYGRYIE